MTDLPMSENERTLYARWTEQGYRPAGYLLFDDQNVFFKTMADITVWEQEGTSSQVVGGRPG
jgi:hypothetical protein